MPLPSNAKPADSLFNLGFEARLWLAADKLRNKMGAAEYKHVVLGLILLKHISDSFQEHHAKLVEGKDDHTGVNPKDPDEYKAENIFGVPPAARWRYLKDSAKQPAIGKIVDHTMVALECDNPYLRGLLPKDHARPGLDKHHLGKLIKLIATIGLGDKESRIKDVLGRSINTSLPSSRAWRRRTAGSSTRPTRAASSVFQRLMPAEVMETNISNFTDESIPLSESGL